MSFLRELRRRHVLRVTVAYLAAAWLLIQVVETLFPVFGLPEAAIRAAVIVLAIGLAPAIILSWVFEWTPEGLRRDTDVAPDAGHHAGASRKLDRVIIVTLTVALGYFAVDKFVIAPGRDVGKLDPALELARRYTALNPLNDPSIAILPFANMSADPEQQHFTDGLTEELLNALVAIDGLRVISRSSSFAFRDRDQSVPEIAAVLGVDHVVEGSVRRAHDRIRITAQLIDASSNSHVWSQTFDSELSVDNVLTIQAEIAATIADALQLELMATTAESPGIDAPASLESLDLYLDGLHYANRIDPFGEDFEHDVSRAIEKFEAAIAADPEWAAPRAHLGRVYHATKELGDPAERLRIARDHVTDALRIDPAYAPAHGSLGYILTVEGDYGNAMTQYDRALALGDNLAHWGKAILLRMLGRHSEAIDLFHIAASLDPLAPAARYQLFESYYCAGRYGAAIDGFNEFFADQMPLANPSLTILMANAYVRAGNSETGLKLAEALAADIGDEAPVASVFALSGQTDRARRALDATAETAPFVILDIAPAEVVLGEHERAMDLLERAAADVESDIGLRFNWLWRLRCSPEVQSLAGNPRFERLLERFGLPH